MTNYFSEGEGSSIKPIEIKIDFRSREPITEQIRNQIRFLIATGRLRPGDQLPTVRQLAADIRVNFNTVARAYRLLDEEGLISTQHGRGTFVLEPKAETATTQMRSELAKELVEKCVENAIELGISREEIEKLVDETLEKTTTTSNGGGKDGKAHQS